MLFKIFIGKFGYTKSKGFMALNKIKQVWVSMSNKYFWKKSEIKISVTVQYLRKLLWTCYYIVERPMLA